MWWKNSTTCRNLIATPKHFLPAISFPNRSLFSYYLSSAYNHAALDSFFLLINSFSHLSPSPNLSSFCVWLRKVTKGRWIQYAVCKQTEWKKVRPRGQGLAWKNHSVFCSLNKKLQIKHMWKINTENYFILARYIVHYFYGLFSVRTFFYFFFSGFQMVFVYFFSPMKFKFQFHWVKRVLFASNN